MYKNVDTGKVHSHAIVFNRIILSIFTILIVTTWNRVLVWLYNTLKNSGKSRSFKSNQTKIKRWKLQTWFYWVCWKLLSMHLQLYVYILFTFFEQFCKMSQILNQIPANSYINCSLKTSKVFNAIRPQCIYNMCNH